MVPGYGPIFRRTGKPLDTLVQDAIEEGFLPRNEENGEPKLREMIAQALGGKRIIAQHAEGVVEAEAQAELKRREEMANEAASALEEVPDASLFHLADEDIPWDTPGKQVDTATFLRALGASEEEIAHEVANESRRAQEDAQGGTGDEEATRVAAQESAASGAEKARTVDSALSSPTREDIVAQQDRAKAGERNAANADRVAAERNQADAERGDFKLTGSDRAADSSADQDRLFTKAANPQTDTPEFKKWFGDSKVVDGNGEPLVVYHGTPNGDITFADKGAGIYFTSSATKADGYTYGNFMRGGGERAIYPAHLSLKNPLVIDANGKRNDNIPVPWAEWKPKVFGNLPKGAVSVRAAYEYAIEHGHDGLIVRNVVDTNSPTEKTKADVYVASKPEQIKSATGNRGTFDPNDANILHTEGGRPFAEFNKLQGKGGISEIAKRDAEKILGIKSPVPVLRRADHEAAANNSPMYYELGSKSIIYNTAYKNRTRAQDAQWMAEEIMHAIDHIEGKRTISLGSDTLKPGGELRQEVEKAMSRSGAIKNFLNYPLKFNISEDRKTVELFARLGVIFKGFPDLLRAAAPKTYEAYRAIFADTVPGEVRGQGRDAAADRQADQRPLSLGESRPDAGIGDQGEQTNSRLAGIRDRSVRALGSTAEGGVGDFGRVDRLEARADTAPDAKPDEESKPQDSPGAGMLDGAKSFFAGIRDDLTNKIAPMSTGSQQARAAAQKFANDTRVARHQWQRLNEVIKAKFNPDERKAMWDAADEQNTLMQKGEPTEGKGLERLNDKQRAVMQQLHGYADSLWKRAQEVGMVEGNGLPFWTPRMAVMVGEDGSFSKPGGDGKTATSKGEGRNVMTSAPSAKHRKYVGTEESESALKGALGDNAQYVHDILTMPLAMSRFEQAIAGRELINQVKEIGLATGKETVASAGGPGFFTLDHPAFTTYKPRMTTDADGKTTALKDEAGNTVMDRAPLFISKEFEGPLKAVMSTRDGAVYSGYMLLKSKAMTVIMASPLTHNMVIYGRALAYSPLKVGTGYLYWKGHILGKDDALMRQAIGHGLVPLGANKNSMMDITDVARGLGREGGWGDPNESWVSLSLQKLGNALHEGAGDAIKAKADALGDFVHHTLLWKQVGAVQIGIYHDMYQYLAAKGYSDKAAGPLAAHFANRYAGAVANENMSELARKSANVLLFSRSFNMGNLGAMKDMAFGMSAGLKAKMMEDVGAIEGGKALNFARRKAIASLLTETGFSVLAQSVVQSAVDKLKKDKNWDEISEGYKRRLASMFDNVSQHPFNPASYNPYQISPTFDNEPKKKDRISIGAQPGGREEYIRLPTGKVVEDMIGWATEPGDTFSKKMSPMAKAVWQDITNDKGYGTPVKDPDGNFFRHVYDLASHVAEAQLPWDQVKTMYDMTQGKATSLDKDKLEGFATGFSYSQGHPGGPEAAVAAKTEERFSADKKYQMELVKRDLKYGDEESARARMDKIGMTPHEQAQQINRIENPKTGLSRAGNKHFNNRANEEERQQMDLQR
jgi:hypothetical protein